MGTSTMAIGAWWAIVHGIVEWDTIEWLSTHTHKHAQTMGVCLPLLQLTGETQPHGEHWPGTSRKEVDVAKQCQEQA